jgi:hypothetical protein
MLVRSNIADADLALVQTLVGLGVDVNQSDISHSGRGHTPLMSAAKEGNIMCLKVRESWRRERGEEEGNTHTLSY